MLEKRGIGRPGVTLDDVRAACRALHEQGRTIGPTNVRLELGRGGYGTITRHLHTLGYAGSAKASKGKMN